MATIGLKNCTHQFFSIFSLIKCTVDRRPFMWYELGWSTLLPSKVGFSLGLLIRIVGRGECSADISPICVAFSFGFTSFRWNIMYRTPIKLIGMHSIINSEMILMKISQSANEFSINFVILTYVTQLLKKNTAKRYRSNWNQRNEHGKYSESKGSILFSGHFG